MIFNDAERSKPSWWNHGRTMSAMIHLLVVFLLVYRPTPAIVKPVLVIRGDRGSSHVVYLAPRSTNDAVAAVKPRLSHASLVAPVKAAIQPIEEKAPQKELQSPDQQTTMASASASSPYGSAYDGATSGPEIKPAIPTTFPDPPRSIIPPGIQGDVVVEVTIDAQGAVVETRVLKTLGFGLEEKIVATLRNWHFRPATKDGSPIPSKQDVHFHFPS